MTNRQTVMISYSHADAAHMRRARAELEGAGFDVLVDRDEFSLSYSTKQEMNRLVDRAQLLLVLLSPNSVASKAVRHEVGRGLTREKVEHRKIVFAGKVRACSRVMAGWPEDRLWASLHADYKTEIRKLIRSLRSAAESVVPLGYTSATPAELADKSEALLESAGMKILGRIGFYSRFGKELEDDDERGIFATPVTRFDLVGPAFFVTYLDWMLFWHFPKVPLTTLRVLADFSESLFASKILIDARIGGYLARRAHSLREPRMEMLARAARRHPKLMDVVVSPHAISSAPYTKRGLPSLTWERQKPFLVYHPTETSSAWHSLPAFFGQRTQSVGDLHILLRLVKAAIRVDIPRLQIPATRWYFLDRTSRGKMGSCPELPRRQRLKGARKGNAVRKRRRVVNS